MNEGYLFQRTGTLVEANIFFLVMRDVTKVSWRVEADAARTVSIFRSQTAPLHGRHDSCG